jgi:hypothetical protein
MKSEFELKQDLETIRAELHSIYTKICELRKPLLELEDRHTELCLKKWKIEEKLTNIVKCPTSGGHPYGSKKKVNKEPNYLSAVDLMSAEDKLALLRKLGAKL